MSSEQLEAGQHTASKPDMAPAEMPSPDTGSSPAVGESTVIPASPTGAEPLIRLLRAAGRGETASRIVAQSLERFGSVRAVLDAPPDALAAALEWDADIIPLLQAARLLVDSLQNAELPQRWCIDNSGELLRYVERTRRPSCPGVRLLLLDAEDFLAADFRVSAATSELEQHVLRTIISEVIASEAPNTILVLETTRADPVPNRLEITQVKLLCGMLATIDVSLHDCIMVAAGGTQSFRTQGLL